MEKIWLKNYPTGIPAEIDVDEYASLKEVFEHSCRALRELPAYSNMGVSISYAELDQASRAFRRLSAAVARPAQGRPGRDHDAQPAAVPGRAVRRAARRPARWSTSIRCTRRASSSTS